MVTIPRTANIYNTDTNPGFVTIPRVVNSQDPYDCHNYYDGYYPFDGLYL